MITRFLLHGGALKKHDSRNDSYFKELTINLSDGDKVLFIGFARRDESERYNVFKRDKSLILAQTSKNIKVLYATHNNFIDQVKVSKAICIAGGVTPLLVEEIKKHPEFVDLLKVNK